MYTDIVQFSVYPAAVTRISRPDGCAEYRLTRDATTSKDSDGNDIIQGKEVYFEVEHGKHQPTEDEILENFDTYWESGTQWPVQEAQLTPDEQWRVDTDAAMIELAEMLDVVLSGGV